MIESLRTTQIAFFRFATPCGVFRGTKSVRARVREIENHMKPFVRTLFLGTRPSCLPSPGRSLFNTDDRKLNLWLGRTGSPVITSGLVEASQSEESSCVFVICLLLTDCSDIAQLFLKQPPFSNRSLILIARSLGPYSIQAKSVSSMCKKPS